MKKARNAIVMAAAGCGLMLPSSAAAAVRCVDPANAACHSTIQQAVDAAGAGDLINIAAGTYYEGVVVPPGKNGLQLLGAGAATTILDPSPYADRGFAGANPGILIVSHDVAVKDITVRNGPGTAVQVAGMRVLIQRVTINGANSNGIQLGPLAWNGRILNNEIRNVGIGVHSAAFGTVVQGNSITGALFGIQLVGDSSRAIGNSIQNGLVGILGGRDGLVVRANDVRHHADDGIVILGSYPTVQGNTVYGADVGIQVSCRSCFGGLVSGNVVTSSRQFGMLVSSDDAGLVVKGNRLARTGGALNVSGFGISVSVNDVSDVGTDHTSNCLEAFGGFITLARNTATRCASSGIRLLGNDLVLDRNLVNGTFGNGITLSGTVNVSLLGNRVTRNAAQGIAIVAGSFNNTVTGNTATGNRLDFCNDGDLGTTVLSGNTFRTTAATSGTDCLIAR